MHRDARGGEPCSGCSDHGEAGLEGSERREGRGTAGSAVLVALAVLRQEKRCPRLEGETAPTVPSAQGRRPTLEAPGLTEREDHGPRAVSAAVRRSGAALLRGSCQSSSRSVPALQVCAVCVPGTAVA